MLEAQQRLLLVAHLEHSGLTLGHLATVNVNQVVASSNTSGSILSHPLFLLSGNLDQFLDRSNGSVRSGDLGGQELVDSIPVLSVGVIHLTNDRTLGNGIQASSRDVQSQSKGFQGDFLATVELTNGIQNVHGSDLSGSVLIVILRHNFYLHKITTFCGLFDDTII